LSYARIQWSSLKEHREHLAGLQRDLRGLPNLVGFNVKAYDAPEVRTASWSS
jgi:hypothetical protein